MLIVLRVPAGTGPSHLPRVNRYFLLVLVHWSWFRIEITNRTLTLRGRIVLSVDLPVSVRKIRTGLVTMVRHFSTEIEDHFLRQYTVSQGIFFSTHMGKFSTEHPATEPLRHWKGDHKITPARKNALDFAKPFILLRQSTSVLSRLRISATESAPRLGDPALQNLDPQLVPGRPV